MNGIKERKKAHQSTADIYQSNQTLICTLTYGDEEKLWWSIMEEGFRYLHHMCRGYQPAIDDIRYEHFYWAWWFEQWYQRDAEFIAYHALKHPTDSDPIHRHPDKLAASYEYWHNERLKSDLLCRAYINLIKSTSPVWSRNKQ
jgi:hypothetical protein